MCAEAAVWAGHRSVSSRSESSTVLPFSAAWRSPASSRPAPAAGYRPPALSSAQPYHSISISTRPLQINEKLLGSEQPLPATPPLSSGPQFERYLLLSINLTTAVRSPTPGPWRANHSHYRTPGWLPSTP